MHPVSTATTFVTLHESGPIEVDLRRLKRDSETVHARDGPRSSATTGASRRPVSRSPAGLEAEQSRSVERTVLVFGATTLRQGIVRR